MQKVTRTRTTVSLQVALSRYISDQVGPGDRFHNFSHGVEMAIRALMERDEAEQGRITQEAREAAMRRLKGHQ